MNAIILFVKKTKSKLTGLLLMLVMSALMSTSYAIEQITYFHNDALGSPVAATDESGNLLWREDYLPYGERLTKQDNGTNDTWFTGKQEDKATGLSYFGARWYDPVLGRFTGIDPVGFQEDNIHSFNRYAYANNNPYKFVDPDGRAAFPILANPNFWIGIGIVGTAIGKTTFDILHSDKNFTTGFGNNGYLNKSTDGDPVSGVLDDAKPGDKTKGRTTNWDKSGGIDQANDDFDKLVPSGAKPIDDSGDDSNGRKGIMKDGRKANVRPNSNDGRPTVEVQSGKNKTKIRYND